MPITTLTNISIPTEGAGSNSSLLMPKLQYRFRVTSENFGISGDTQELTKQVIDATRPTLSFDPIVLEVYNSKIHMAGKHTWNTVSLNLRDDVSGNVQKLVGEQLQKQFDFMEQASANSGQDYKFVTRIEILDGGNGATGVQVLETWECYGCFITEANYNSLAYANNDPVSVTLSIQYDNAIQTPENTGLGTAVGRALGTNVTGGG